MLEPRASSDIVGKFWEILELAANSGSHLPENLGKSGKIWDSDGIVRGCTNHAPRTASCDSAACED